MVRKFVYTIKSLYFEIGKQIFLLLNIPSLQTLGRFIYSNYYKE